MHDLDVANRAAAVRWPIVSFVLLLLTASNWRPATAIADQAVAASGRREAKKVIGPVATVEEAESDMDFKARVDTGATTSSVHADRWNIEDEAERMVDNVGKTIRFRIKNHRGESEWLKRKIVDISEIKTSESAEERYKVRLTLCCGDVKKRVLVSLNDRSHMNYPILLGRNFLRGDFVVDVDMPRQKKRASEPPKTAEPVEADGDVKTDR